jgi:hypothetical protein
LINCGTTEKELVQSALIRIKDLLKNWLNYIIPNVKSLKADLLEEFREIMNRNEKVYALFAALLTFFGVTSLIAFLFDSQNSFIYGILSIWLLIPGAVLFLAAFQSKIKLSTN